MSLEITNLQVRVGSFCLGPISLTVNQGDYLLISGPNGSGKTTLLETICGLKKMQTGSIVLNEKEITDRDPSQRNIAYVPQDVGLFPSMTVGQQIAFPLQVRKWAKAKIEHRVNELLKELQLSDLTDRKPDQLSGGQQQRVALARALSFDPSLICLDEPLSSLDLKHRQSMIELLQKIHKQFRIPIMHVTHDQNEAERLSTHRLCF